MVRDDESVRLVNTIDGLCQRTVIRITDTADRGFDSVYSMNKTDCTCRRGEPAHHPSWACAQAVPAPEHSAQSRVSSAADSPPRQSFVHEHL